MKHYKLLNQDRTTYGGMTWPVGKWRKAKGSPKKGLCTDGWLHCYDDPYLALFLNPIHAGIKNPIVCEVEVRGDSLNDNGLKRGFRKMRVIRDITIKRPTPDQWVEFAIRCVLVVYNGSIFVQWANNWLSGKDRSENTAWAAAWEAAAASATASAAWAATSAAWAATGAAWEAAGAASATENIAWEAADAVETIAETESNIGLIKIARQVMGV